MNKNIPKTNNIFLNFTITAPVRINCKKILSEFITWIENKEYGDYLNTLASYRYCICVEGNGLDTHRFWECLYLKVIPICLKNQWTERNYKKFPMIFLNDWNELKNYNFSENEILNFSENEILNLNTYFLPVSVMTNGV